MRSLSRGRPVPERARVGVVSLFPIVVVIEERTLGVEPIAQPARAVPVIDPEQIVGLEQGPRLATLLARSLRFTSPHEHAPPAVG